MATKIVTKNSSTASAVPTASDLVQGELAVNVADKRLFTEDNAGAIVELGTNPSTLTVTGEITANGGIALGDNDKATFGASDDLQIYHDGSDSYIKDAGAGNLYLDSSDTIIRANGTENSAKFIGNGRVELYYDAVKKFETTSTGIDVTGTADVTLDLNVGGAVKGNAGTRAVSIGTAGSVTGGLQLWSSTTGTSYVQFGDESGTAANHYRGYMAYNHANDSMSLGTSGSTRATIDSSGNLLVGTTSTIPFTFSSGSGAGITSGGTIMAGATAEAGLFNRVGSDGAIIQLYKAGGVVGSIGTHAASTYIGQGDTGLYFNNGNNSIDPYDTSTPAPRGDSISLGAASRKFADLYLSGTAKSQAVELEDIKAKDTSGLNLQTSNGQKRVILDNSGNLLVGKTVSGQVLTKGVELSASGGVFSCTDTAADSSYFSNIATSGTRYLQRFYAGSTNVGSINSNGTATTYATSSDQRLKENIVDALSASDDIDAIQVRSFDWKADGSHQKYGMVAQELVTVAPEAVSGDADSEEMMGVDYSKLVPMLIKEIQSLRNRVAQLEE